MLFGLIVVIIGFLFLLEAMVPGFHVNFSLIWPLLLVIFPLHEMIKRKRIDWFSLVIVFIGIWFLMGNLGLIDEHMRPIFWPVIVMIVGLSIILSSLQFQKKAKKMRPHTKGDANYYGVFSGLEERIKTNDFKGATVYAVFGGVELDLREVEIKGESAVIYAYSVFGGTDILVPEGYNIVMNSNAIFGGNDNKSKNEFKEKQKTIYINCTSVFGGTEIK